MYFADFCLSHTHCCLQTASHHYLDRQNLFSYLAAAKQTHADKSFIKGNSITTLGASLLALTFRSLNSWEKQNASRGCFPKHFLSSPFVYKSQICSELTSHIQTQVCDFFPALMFFSPSRPLCFVSPLQRQAKYSENKLKCTKARNDYLLNLAATNAVVAKYYIHDVSDMIDVSMHRLCACLFTPLSWDF